MAVPIRFKRGNYANLPALQPGEPAFTLDTNELYVGLNSTTDGNKFFGSHRYWTRESTTTGSGINLVEGSDNGSAYLTLQAPGSLTGITTYTLPGTDGSYGSILITDGSGNLSFSGITGADGNLKVSGITTFSNDVRFEDNVRFIDDKKLNFGVSDELSIYSNGTNSYIDVNSGRLYIRNNTISDHGGDIYIQAKAGENSIVALDDSSVVLYFDGSNRLTTNAAGIDVTGTTVTDNLNVSGVSTFTGDIDVDGHTELDNLNVSGVSTFNNSVDIIGNTTVVGDVFLSGPTNTLQVQTIINGNLDATGAVSQIGQATFVGDVAVNANLDVDGHTDLDNVIISGVTTTSGLLDINAGGRANTFKVEDLTPQRVVVAGGGGELEDNANLTFDGYNLLVGGDISATNAEFSGNVTIGGTLTYEDVTQVDSVGIATARVGLDVLAGGINVTGVSTFKNNVHFGNDDRIIFGTADDLQVFNDGLNSYVLDSGVGNLHLRGSAAIKLQNTAGTENYANFNVDGASELYYDNSKKIETTNDGILVSGVTSTTTAKIGAATTFTEDLVVQGDARVTGILTVGTSSIIFDGPNDNISVGGAATVSTSGFEVGISTVHSTGIEVGNSSIHTAGFDIGSSSLHSTGLSVENLSISGIITAASLDVSGTVDIDLNVLGNTYYVAEGGSDSNDGDNINKPFRTIAQALSVATNGDIVNVSAGTFEEICPLTIPRGVTLKGAGLRATTVKPTDATKTNNVFLLNDISTVEDFTIRNSYYNSSADTGYAFAYSPGIAITTRSPYIQRVTVLNTGTTISASDPYGYDTADNPPTTHVAGRGALIDGSVVASNSLEAGMLFNEVTFFTPNNNGITLTNGARVEYLNCFHYFASQAIVGTSGTVGIAGTANVRLKFDNPSVTPSVNDVVKLRDGGGTVVAVGTITTYNSPYAEISGKGSGTFTVGIGTTQDVKFYQSDGTTQTGIADAITLADYTKFGAEMRSVGCAFEYGNQGVIADGIGVKLRLFATNFNHIGSGKDFTNDDTLTVQANEVVELNSGQVSYVSIDQSGDFRVGDAFVVSQETGSVSFAATTYNLETTGNLTVTDGGSNQSVLSPTSLTVGDLQLASSTLSSLSGDITIDPAGSNQTIVSGDLSVTGIVTAAELNTGPNGIGIGVSTITGPAEIIIDPSAVGDNTGKVIIKGDLQVDGTETIVNSTTITVDDKNIVLGSGAVNDAAADGGGITLESGDGDKTINWIDSTDSWTFSENVNLAATKTYKINGVDVLSSTTLGAGVTQSSLTSVGTLDSLLVSGAINSTTDVQINGTSVLQSASDEAIALAIALG